ncbi:MAG: radical SAM family heme chaperone HemW [Thermoleophilia bacterium]
MALESKSDVKVSCPGDRGWRHRAGPSAIISYRKNYRPDLFALTTRHLYIHIPFCSSRCGYCDFFSQSGKLELAPAYVGALLAEMEASLPEGTAPAGLQAAGSRGLETVYIGGGTPTLLGADLLAVVLETALRRCGDEPEITVEANPSTLTPELAAGLAAAGVNRVSLGAQSFDPGLRRNLGREGPARAIAEAVKELRRAGIGSIGLDLMFSIPGQTAAGLESDLDRALALEPDHLSCYELTVKEGSAFQRRWLGELEAAAARGRGFYELAVDRLEGAGYRWYETSNFSLPGKECRHNLAYWDGSDYLGLGAGAWSTVGTVRWRNSESLEGYIEAAAGGGWEGLREIERLDPRGKISEKLLLGLRRDRGVERGAVAAVLDSRQEKGLLRNGFLVNEGGRICLTRQGRFVANEVCARLLRD